MGLPPDPVDVNIFRAQIPREEQVTPWRSLISRTLQSGDIQREMSQRSTIAMRHSVVSLLYSLICGVLIESSVIAWLRDGDPLPLVPARLTTAAAHSSFRYDAHSLVNITMTVPPIFRGETRDAEMRTVMLAASFSFEGNASTPARNTKPNGDGEGEPSRRLHFDVFSEHDGDATKGGVWNMHAVYLDGQELWSYNHERMRPRFNVPALRGAVTRANAHNVSTLVRFVEGIAWLGREVKQTEHLATEAEVAVRSFNDAGDGRGVDLRTYFGDFIYPNGWVPFTPLTPQRRTHLRRQAIDARCPSPSNITPHLGTTDTSILQERAANISAVLSPFLVAATREIADSARVEVSEAGADENQEDQDRLLILGHPWTFYTSGTYRTLILVHDATPNIHEEIDELIRYRTVMLIGPEGAAGELRLECEVLSGYNIDLYARHRVHWTSPDGNTSIASFKDLHLDSESRVQGLDMMREIGKLLGNDDDNTIHEDARLKRGFVFIALAGHHNTRLKHDYWLQTPWSQLVLPFPH